MQLTDDDVLANQDMDSPITYVASPRDDHVLREVRKYQTSEIANVHELQEYGDFLRGALKPLGLFSEDFLPRASSECYKVTFRGQLVAIFRLTPAAPESAFHRTIPGGRGKKILEVNNVAVEQSYKGDLLLGIIMRNCALLSHVKGYDFVAGLIRYEILPLFTDFGTIPVRHTPFHVLGDEDVHDFVTYFMTDSKEHIDYAISRSYHYFHRKVTMRGIAADVDELKLCAAEAMGS
ncbi:hypothetical protein ACFQ0X_06390 [Streptomyces rectiviolaceus]|uniref:Uncharacterized protein n=1 Tax=Streptomyces rectiviolaceus TaxID=332591 RepID=A0ABP6MQ01_9ACTN